MALIPLRARNGTVRAWATVDDRDFERVAVYCWCLQLGPRGGYAIRTDRSGPAQRTVLLHREVLGLGSDDPEVDHRDGDKLNCRRGNLRVVTHAQNAQNQTRVRGRSRYRGVAWNVAARAWSVRVGINYRRVFGGYFADEDEAGRRAAELRAELLTHTAEAA